MNYVSRLLFSVIFEQPLPPNFDKELASELYKGRSELMIDSFALRRILLIWLGRTPEVEQDVREEILRILQGVIDENLAKKESGSAIPLFDEPTMV